MARVWALQVAVLLATGCLAASHKGSERTSDTGDWIPLAQPCPTCRNQASGAPEPDQLAQKSGRVLNIAAAPYPRDLYASQQAFQETLYPSPHAQQFQPTGADGQVPQQLQQRPRHHDQHVSQNAQAFQVTGQAAHAAPLVQSAPENLTPQFLPHLQEANFNGNLQPPQLFAQTAQAFLPPGQQYVQQPNLVQPHNDFQLLQQLLSSQNVQFADLFDLNQTLLTPGPELQPGTATAAPSKPPPASAATSVAPTTLKPKLSQQAESAGREEEVQLLYVPLETLRQRGPARVKQEPVTEKVFRTFEPTPLSDFYQTDYRKQSQLQTIQRDYAQQSAQAQRLQQQLRQPRPRPTSTVKSVVLSSSAAPYSTVAPAPSSTAAPAPAKRKTKLKPHQPPLAVFMGGEATRGATLQVDDVLSVLKHARTISVLDQVAPDMPQVFVGPSTLKPPNGYTKFDLPYLSSLENNRVQRKVEQFPFFVAPLSYNAPDGYAKIPFPAPHVGSVIIKEMRDIHDKQPEPPAYNIYMNAFQQQQQQQQPFNQNVPPSEKTRSRRPQFPVTTLQPIFDGQFTPITYSSSTPTPPPSPSFGTQTNPYRTYSSPPAAGQQTASTTPSALVGHYTPEGHFITAAAFNRQQQQLQQQSYTTSPRPVPVSSSSRTPLMLANAQGPTSPANGEDDKYTVLEQFPIRSDPTTQNILLNGYREAERTSTRAYAQFDFDQFRNNPVGINEEFAVIRGNYQPQPVQTVGAGAGTGFSSTLRPLQRPPAVTSLAPIASSSTAEPTPPPPQPQSTPAHLTFSQTQPPPPPPPPQSPQLTYEMPKFYSPQPYGQQTFSGPPTAPMYIVQAQPGAAAFPYTSPAAPARGTLQYTDPQYNLPVQLPPINPNLPGLINSLQDGQQQQYSSMSSTSPDSAGTPYHSSTPAQLPVSSSSSTSSPRRPTTRGRPRAQSRPTAPPTAAATTTTTATPPSAAGRTRNTSRRRRPYNGRPRPEYEKYLAAGQRDVASSTTTERPAEASPAAPIVDITTARPSGRNRYTYQHDQTHSQSTEAPKRNLHQTRTRFRTRGRQQKPPTTTTAPTTTTTTTAAAAAEVSDTEAPAIGGAYPNGHQNKMTERSSFVYPSTEAAPAFQQPKLEGGFQVSPPFATHQQQQQQQQQPQQAYVEQSREQQEYIVPDQRRPVYQHAQYQQQPYVEQTYNGAHHDVDPPQAHNPVYSSTSEPATPAQYLVETSAGPENVRNVQYDSAVISRPVAGEEEYVRFNGGTPQTTLLQQYPSTTTTTTTTRRTPAVVRTRGRTRARNRVYSSSSTTPPTTSTERHYSTTSTRAPEPAPAPAPAADYYAFLHQPQYPGETEYGTQPPHQFSQTERASTVSDETFPPEDVYTPGPAAVAYPTYDVSPAESPYGAAPYLPHTPTTTDADEITTRRHFLNNAPPVNRFVRPPASSTPRTPSGKYTVRPTKRPDLDPPKITKIRGRIRKPTTSTTTTTTTAAVAAIQDTDSDYVVGVDDQPTYALRPPYPPPSAGVNELAGEPPRARIPSRGRTHFRRPDGAPTPSRAAASHADLSGENYPAAFLEAQTRKPEFRITVAPAEDTFDGDEDDYDQVPYSSLYRPRVIPKGPEQGGAETKWTKKYTSTYFRRANNATNTTHTTTNRTTAPESSSSANVNQTVSTADDGNNKSIFDQIFEQMAKFGTSETTTEAVKMAATEESVGEIKVTKGRKRGFWKRVRVRPVDVLETAESQYVGSAAANNLISDAAKQSYPRPSIEQYVITFEPENENETVHELPVREPGVAAESTTAAIGGGAEMTTMAADVTTLNPAADADMFDAQNDEPASIYSLFDMFNIPHPAEEVEVVASPEPSAVTAVAELGDGGDSVDVTTTGATPDLAEATTLVSGGEVTTVTSIDEAERDGNKTMRVADEIKMYTERLEDAVEGSPPGVVNRGSGKLDALILGTSTSTEISHETEICYRGRCVKSNTTEPHNGSL